MRTRDPFGRALATLRDALGRDGLAAGQHLPITDIAVDLKLSTSPVREALSRLCGEGLIEDRRGLGYFTRTLPAEDIVGLLQLERCHLELAMTLLDAPPPAAEDLLQFERWSADLMERCDNEPLKESFERVSARLVPVRRLERRLETEGEAVEEERCVSLEHYYEKRLTSARSLASAIRRIVPTPGEYSSNRV